MSDPRPLRATYRLELSPAFDFAHAAALVPYFERLGVSHLYLSPILEAAAGSTHGYDVIDHSKISEALGGEAGFEKLAAAAHAAGLGLVLDIVPNHMSISDPRNRWWWDVLENGRSGRWAHAFDIDWDPPEQRMKNVVLIPVLGDHRSRLIEKREIALARDGARFFIHYHEHRFPAAPRPLGALLQHAARRCDNDRFTFIADAMAALPGPTALDSGSIHRRHRDKAVLRALLEELMTADPKVAAAIDQTVQQTNNTPQMLDALLERQNYRLAFWRAAERELDYRRFFDINSLLALRMEDPHVFSEAHALIGRLVAAGQVDGLRVDHVDGLADPAAYLKALRALAPAATIHVEKILGSDEPLEPWPVEGTTGYEFAADLTRVFLPPEAEGPLTTLAASLCGIVEPFDAVATRGKQQVLKELLGSDVSRLANLLLAIGDRYHELRDYSRHDLRAGIAALATACPVYRTYVVPKEPEHSSGRDAALLTKMVEAAKALAPSIDPALFDFMHGLFTGERTGVREADFVRRFQQLSAPAMAKGVEDTAFYRDTRLLALDEVGADPSRFSLRPADFHRHNQTALERWPLRLLATSTHDTKRSEDVRARLVAMGQRAERFAPVARAFFEQAKAHVSSGMPDPGLQMVLLQSLIGAWPLDLPRLQTMALKSAREARLNTNWVNPDGHFEKALEAFCAGVHGDQKIAAALEAFVATLEPAARAISLGWSLLKCTCPGVPDLYQGNELWNHSLVDPDNRRPVDWHALTQCLANPVTPMLADDTLGALKLRVISTALALRKEQPSLFGKTSHYTPLAATGAEAHRVLAFSRGDGKQQAVIAVTLIPEGAWGDTTLALPEGRFRSRFDGEALTGPVRLDALFSKLPVTLLHGVPG
jgi:(1->4)-alpha-D-glucan 1-alpha-D-glucosylmutase